MPNAYEQGRRDGQRGLERSAAYTDVPAHTIWLAHLAYHEDEADAVCSLDCRGLAQRPDANRKRLRQQGTLARTTHLCPHCEAPFRTESLAAERSQYELGFLAGQTLYARDQQKRRTDQQRRQRRARRRL